MGFVRFLGHFSLYLLGFCGVAQDGCVEECDQGRGQSEASDDLFEQRGAGRGLSGERRADAPLAREDEVLRGENVGVGGGEAAGQSGERRGGAFRFKRGHMGEKFFVGEDSAEFSVVLDDVAADGQQLLRRGHVAAGGDEEFGGGEVEVEAGTGGLLHAGAGEPGGDLGLVGAGGLVAGGVEAGVAIDAHHGLVGRPDVFAGDGGEGVVDLLDEGEHGVAELALEDGPARVEPGAVVVAGEAAE